MKYPTLIHLGNNGILFFHIIGELRTAAEEYTDNGPSGT